MRVKLQPTPGQAAALLRTMERFNAACDAIAAVAFRERCANKVELQKLVYHETRRDFGLSAQMAIRAISKVVEVYKRDRDIKPSFRPHGAIVYDQRILSWKGPDRVSLLTLDGRALMPFVTGAYGERFAGRLRGQADLVYRGGMFFLYVAVDVGEAEPFEPQGFLGVDLGLKHIAATSDGETFSGAHVASLRARHSRLRSKLQKKGTKSAKRLLKRRGAKEARFQHDVNHRLGKAIVRVAQDTLRGIAVEDLTGIRERTTVKKSQRRAHNSWAFAHLRHCIAYKAALAGVPVVAVDPRDTSRACPCCGLVDKRNRPTRDRFKCIGCGHAGAADTTAAINIARKGEAMAGQTVMLPHAGLRSDGALASLGL